MPFVHMICRNDCIIGRPPHVFIYISAGSAKIFSDGHEATLPSGTVCVIPPFTPHRIEYINASVRRILFGISYINRYLLKDAIDNFPHLYATNVTLSKRSRNAEIIETLVEEINQYKGESAYIYIYKLMSDCVSIPQIQNDSKLIVLLWSITVTIQKSRQYID